MTLLTRSCFLYRILSPHAAGRSLSNSHLIPSVTKIVSLPKFYSSGGELKPSDKMTETLRHKFPLAKRIEVVDVSGGCGSMYEIFVESVEFKGLPIVKQHRLINDVLKEDIKQMHGLRISTKVPTENG